MGKGGGSQPTTQTVQQSNIPEYARPYFEDIMTRGQTASQVQYQPYTGERVADFSPLQQQAQTGAAQLGPSPLLGSAAGLTGLAAGQATQAGQYNPLTSEQVFSRPGAFVGTGSFAQPGIAGAYMSPYMQNVVDIQQREAQRQADIARTQRGAQAIGAGAFGGSRQAIMEAEAARNLAQQKGDIQAAGLQSAYQQAQQAYQTDAARQLQTQLANQQMGLAGLQAAEQSRQFGAGLGQQGIQQLLSAAGQMGQIGQTAFGQQVGAMQAQQQAGAVQQAQEQQKRDLAYEEFMRQQLYPQSQLQFLSSLLRGSVVAPQQTMYSYQQQPSLVSQLTGLAGGLGSLGKAFGSKEGGEIKSYAEGGGIEGGEGAFASTVAKLVKVGIADPRLIDQDMTASPLEKRIAKMKVAQMRQAYSNQEAMTQGVPQGTVLDSGVGGLDIEEPEYEAANGGIVSFQSGGESAATARYQGALSQSFPVSFGRQLGAGVADIVRLPGAFAWEVDPETGQLRRRYEREGFFPISQEAWEQRAKDAETRAVRPAPFVTPDGRRVVDQIPAQNVPPTSPAGINFQAANDAAQQQQQAGIGTLIRAPGPAATPPAAPQPTPRGPGAAAPRAASSEMDEMGEMRREHERMLMEGQKRDTPEEAEKRIRAGYAEKFPSELPERLKELTNEAQSAIKTRDQDRWLALAQGFFAAAAGESPYALKNFAQGLGLTTKEFMSINKDFQAAEKERKKMELALRQQDRAERMGIEDKANAARATAEGHRDRYNQFLATFNQRISETGISTKLAREKLDVERQKVAATQAGVNESRMAREENRESVRLNNLAQRFGQEVDRVTKLIASPTAAFDPKAMLEAEAQARTLVLQRNPQYREVAGDTPTSPPPRFDLSAIQKELERRGK